MSWSKKLTSGKRIVGTLELVVGVNRHPFATGI
jgi:hypothetical protein